MTERFVEQHSKLFFDKVQMVNALTHFDTHSIDPDRYKNYLVRLRRKGPSLL